MKLKFFLFFIIIFSLQCIAGSSIKTKIKAENLLGKPVTEVSAANPNASQNFIPDGIREKLFLFNSTDGKGFVVMYEDNSDNKILGYSRNGSIDYDKAPEALKWLLSEYKNSLNIPGNKQSEIKKIYKANRNFVSEKGSNVLLNTQWGQGEPYNSQCPLVDGQRSLTGCVATAMAQVINYERKSANINSIPEYWTSKGLYCEALVGKEFDFENLDNEELAWLMRYCGQSVEMNYGVQESGASTENIPGALRNYFGWEDEVNLMERGNYNDEHWNRIIREEIASGHPIIYSASSKTGEGHCFVVDGYSDGFYHVNWGWDGFSDGYYSFELFGEGNTSEYILRQCIVTLRDDDPSSDIITYGTTINGINYDLHSDHTASVLPLKNGEKYSGEVIIPSNVEYQGVKYTVNYFGQSAFVNCRHLTSLSIPATITGQEWCIFDGCYNLKKVNVEDLTSFINLEVGGWWTGSPLIYGADLYLNNKIVRKLEIPDGIKKIDYCKFAECRSIESVVFPSTMEVVGQGAFSNCSNLRSVDMLGSNIRAIDLDAFLNCESLLDVTLPSSLKTIYDDSFGEVNGPGCRQLRNVVCLASTPPRKIGDNDAFSRRTYSDAILYVPSGSISHYRSAKDWENFEVVNAASNVKQVPRTATVKLAGIEYELNLDDKYSRIIDTVDGEFDGHALIDEDVEYEGEKYPVEEIGFEAFFAQHIQDIKLPSTIRRIGQSSFYATNVQNDFILPDSVKVIPKHCFWAFKANKLVIGAGVEEIREDGVAWHDYNSGWNDGQETYIPEIECRSLIPPVIRENSFDNSLYNYSKLTVPSGVKKAYLTADGWSNFKKICNIGEEQEPNLKNDLVLVASPQGKTYLRNGMSLTISGKVFNRGEEKVDRIALNWDINGKSIGNKAIKTTLNAGDSEEFTLKIPITDLTPGLQKLLLEVRNGAGIEDDDKADNVNEFDFDIFNNGYYRVNLIEQFTSESCSLTPMANDNLLKYINETENSEFVARVMHHCGYLDDFLTLNHDYEWFYGNSWGVYTPAVMLNRSVIEQDMKTPVMSVTDNFRYNLENESDICDAAVAVSLERTDDSIIVNTLLSKESSFDTENGYDYLTVFLLEDSIPGREQLGTFTDGYLTDYYHNKALRKVLTYVWGQPIEWTENRALNRFIVNIDPEWNVDNLSAVAFIHRYNPDDCTKCEVFTAGDSALPQYLEMDKNDSSYKIWNSNGVDEIMLENREITCSIGDEIQLGVIFSSSSQYNNYFDWKSSDDKVVKIESVNADGTEVNLRALSEGESTIRVSSINGLFVDCRIRVEYTNSISLMKDDAKEVSVYSIDGVMIKRKCSPYYLQYLPKGCYIILSNGKRYKIFK